MLNATSTSLVSQRSRRGALPAAPSSLAKSLARWAPLLAAALLFCAACKQTEGERCQQTDDCEPGLTCALSDGSNPKAGGTCKGSGTVTPQPVNDLTSTTPPPDMTTPPAPDMTMPVDM